MRMLQQDLDNIGVAYHDYIAYIEGDMSEQRARSLEAHVAAHARSSLASFFSTHARRKRDKALRQEKTACERRDRMMLEPMPSRDTLMSDMMPSSVVSTYTKELGRAVAQQMQVPESLLGRDIPPSRDKPNRKLLLLLEDI